MKIIQSDYFWTLLWNNSAFTTVIQPKLQKPRLVCPSSVHYLDATATATIGLSQFCPLPGRYCNNHDWFVAVLSTTWTLLQQPRLVCPSSVHYLDATATATIGLSQFCPLPGRYCNNHDWFVAVLSTTWTLLQQPRLVCPSSVLYLDATATTMIGLSQFCPLPGRYCNNHDWFVAVLSTTWSLLQQPRLVCRSSVLYLDATATTTIGLSQFCPLPGRYCNNHDWFVAVLSTTWTLLQQPRLICRSSVLYLDATATTMIGLSQFCSLPGRYCNNHDWFVAVLSTTWTLLQQPRLVCRSSVSYLDATGTTTICLSQFCPLPGRYWNNHDWFVAVLSATWTLLEQPRFVCRSSVHYLDATATTTIGLLQFCPLPGRYCNNNDWFVAVLSTTWTLLQQPRLVCRSSVLYLDDTATTTIGLSQFCPLPGRYCNNNDWFVAVLSTTWTLLQQPRLFCRSSVHYLDATATTTIGLSQFCQLPGRYWNNHDLFVAVLSTTWTLLQQPRLVCCSSVHYLDATATTMIGLLQFCPLSGRYWNNHDLFVAVLSTTWTLLQQPRLVCCSSVHYLDATATTMIGLLQFCPLPGRYCNNHDWFVAVLCTTWTLLQQP